jgi:hypothetical protein
MPLVLLVLESSGTVLTHISCHGNSYTQDHENLD